MLLSGEPFLLPISPLNRRGPIHKNTEELAAAMVITAINNRAISTMPALASVPDFSAILEIPYTLSPKASIHDPVEVNRLSWPSKSMFQTPS